MTFVGWRKLRRLLRNNLFIDFVSLYNSGGDINKLYIKIKKIRNEFSKKNNQYFFILGQILENIEELITPPYGLRIK